MTKPRLSKEWQLIFFLAAFKLILHFLTNTNYELQRDAFLYLAMGDHLDLGYASVPPAIAFWGRLVTTLFGDSVFAVRLLPALIGALSVIIVGAMVRRLGGKNWAILLACTAFIISPAFLRSNTLFQPVTFNQFFWLLSGYIILLLLQTGNPKLWLYFGGVAGLAFLNKYSVLFFVLAILIGILLTPERRLLSSKYFGWAALLGFLIILPNLIWQFNHNWPVLQHMAELQQTQLVNVLLSDFILMQFLMNLPCIIIWLFGLAFLFKEQGRRFRAMGLAFLFLILLLMLLRGKAYYTLGVYPILFAFGGFAVERKFSHRFQFMRPAILTFMIFLAMPIIPYSLPLLSLEKMVVYAEKSKAFGLAGALRWEDGEIHALPQDYADMTGWQELAEIVIRTYQNLPDDEKIRTAILAENYGAAGAIKYHGRKHGLPEPISFSGSFLFWAPDSVNIDKLIYINDEIDEISYYFEDVVEVGKITDVHARESGLPVFLCQNPINNFDEFYRKKVKKLKQAFQR